VPVGYDKLYGTIIELMMSLLCYKVFILISYEYPVKKSFAFFLFIWNIINVCLFAWINPDLSWYSTIIALEIFVYIWTLAYCCYRGYNLQSDKYSDNGVYLVFKQPVNFIDYVHCIFLKPVSSVSVVIDGEWFGYTLGRNYRSEKYEPHNTDTYIKLDIKSMDAVIILNKMIGAKWGITNNCCHAAQQLFKYNFNLLDSFPCVFFKKVRKLINDR
jgi:hypothetical protein